MTQRVAIIGCGIVGAAIAYELSREPHLTIFVLDQQMPAQGASGAALGVLMGIISQKVKGKAWALRQASMRRYETLIPELEAVTGQSLPWNRDGIVLLRLDDDPLERWQALQTTRQQQGWTLELWHETELRSRCPQIESSRVAGAIYSPSDRQINPTALTQALVNAAQQQGVQFQFEVSVHQIKNDWRNANQRICQRLQIRSKRNQSEWLEDWLDVDWVIIAAGLGSTQLTQQFIQSAPPETISETISETIPGTIEIRPVLGQALRLRLPQPLGDPKFQPVITGEDIHLVPLGQGDYWVGATVEFPDASGAVNPEAEHLQAVLQGAIALCPAFAQAEIIQTWSGLRPRPWHRSAPMIEPLPGFTNVMIATGHYRNGILLAPATAYQVRDWIRATAG